MAEVKRHSDYRVIKTKKMSSLYF